ncbi:MAG: Na/Pi symporter [Ignavibacteriaceae bacterium]
METIGTLLAGLGLFFIGIKTVSSQLKKIASRRFRLLIAAWTKSKFLSAVWGFSSGAVTQSTSGATFILVSLISSGLLSVRSAFPIIIWANIGTSTLVLLTVLDIKLLVFYLIGIAGLMFAFNKPVRLSNTSGVLYGIGILFFGLVLLKQSAEPLAASEWFRQVLISTQDSLILAFFIGAVLRVVAQSSSAVSVLAIAMTLGGLFTVDQTIMIIYGTNVGASLTTYFLSFNLKGTTKQVAIFQVLLNLLGALIFIPLLYIENSGVPMVKALVFSLTSDISKQMAYVYILNKVVSGALAASFLSPVYKFLQKFWAPTKEEEFTRLHYIHDYALQDPSSALELVEKEQERLIKYFPHYIDSIRNSSAYDSGLLHNSYNTVSQELQNFLTELVNSGLSQETSERLINLQNRQSYIVSLENNLYEFSKLVLLKNYSDKLEPLLNNFIEGLDALLLTAAEAVESREHTDIEILFHVTADKGDLMERIRKTYLDRELSLEYEDKAILLFLTNIFERIVWMLNQVSRLLNKNLETAKRGNPSKSIIISE